MTRAQVLKFVRLTHLYIGVFISPAILFFAFTGALQTFSLHEPGHGRTNYKPPAWIVTLGQLHKNQTPVVPVRRQPPPGRGPSAERPDHFDPDHADKPASAAPSPNATTAQPHPADSKPAEGQAPPRHDPLPLKIFFLLVAIGLFTSTLSGIYMSYKYTRSVTLVTTLWIAGIVIPLLMIIL
jgi:uncharacterized iron-regulated membrane protein